MGRPKIDWGAERVRYESGTESFTDVASRLGVSKSAVEKQSKSGGSWATLRRNFREKNANKAADRAGETYATKLARVGNLAADVAEKALKKLADRLDANDLDDRVLIGAAKLGTAMRLEMSGPGGAPISIDLDLSGLTDEELRKLAAE